MKPIVFNYQEYERVVEENKKLNAEVADLRIRCRIADGDKRDCKSCKHQKPDGCSRWDCEYEQTMSDLIKKSDAIEAVASRDETDGTVKVFTGREVNEILSALPSADAVEVVRCKDCKYFEYNHTEVVDGVPLILAHEICAFWGGGSKTSENGYCSFGERKEQSDEHDK